MTLQAADRVIAGGPEDFMEVRHLTLRGTNREIGRYLARLARDDLGVRKVPWTDSSATRAQRCFLARNWPQQAERAAGVADGFGIDPADDSIDCSFLAYHVGLPGCSCVYYPPGATIEGRPFFSRNFDYTTGSYLDRALAVGAYTDRLDRAVAAPPPYASRPFLIEAYPDTGYSSLYLAAFDLLGAIDGINSEGLTVALLNEQETSHLPGFEPLSMNGVGLSEGQVPRFLLDTCATAAEAREALLGVKQYYAAGPCHYLIGDRHGDGFVWEYGVDRNRTHIIDAAGAPLPVTNHLIHDHQCTVPDMLVESIRRLKGLREGIAAAGPIDKTRIRAINAAVAARLGVGEGQYITAEHPARTLWYALYDPQERSVEIDFYLGEDGDIIRRTAPQRFILGGH